MADTNPRRERYVADKRDASSRGFYIHLTVYVLVIALLVVINAMTSGPWWVQWPLIGWGIGILFHAYLARNNLNNPFAAKS